MNSDESDTYWQYFLSGMGAVCDTSTTVLMIEVLVFLVCLVISAIMSASETALTSMSKLRVKRLFSEDDNASQRLEPWLHEPNRFLVTILIGNNFVNILASVVSAHLSEVYLLYLGFENAVAFSSALAVACTTFILLVFGEILPKTFSKEHAVTISLAMIGPLDFLSRLMHPISIFFIVLSNFVIKIIGGHTIKEVPLMTEDDVRTLIEVSEREGVLEPHETEMIASIIDFDERPVKEIMTPRVDFSAISCELPIEDVIAESVKYGHSRIPVFENDLDHIIGILYVKDLLKVDWREQSVPVKSLIRPVIYIPNTKKMDEVLKMFRLKRTHIAIVVDEYGTTDGLVTIEDLLEEIVGDIQDEYDTEEPDYEMIDDQTIIADAKIDLDDLSRLIEIEFAATDVETLGGFITQLTGRVPRRGEQIDYETIRFSILDSDERKISKVKISLHVMKKHELDLNETVS